MQYAWRSQWPAPGGAQLFAARRFEDDQSSERNPTRISNERTRVRAYARVAKDLQRRYMTAECEDRAGDEELSVSVPAPVQLPDSRYPSAPPPA